METLEALAHGFSIALTWQNLLWALAGVTLGTMVGILPGIGPALTVALLVPVTAQGALVGVLAVGEKRSGVGYSRDDRIALTTLANQTAVAVENARLYAAAQHELAERQRAETAMRASLQEKEVLLKEIHHRVKNNLQMIYSLLSLQSQYADDPTTLEALRDSQNRIRSMALIHEKLYQSTNLADIDFGEYLRSLASHLHRSYAVKDRNVRLVVSTAPIRLGIDTALPCALIASELISNALKHAFVGRPEGVLRVNIGTDDRGTIRLEVEDDGTPSILGPSRFTGPPPRERLKAGTMMASSGTFSYLSPPPLNRQRTQHLSTWL
mgnify:CR=1 FL=1